MMRTFTAVLVIVVGVIHALPAAVVAQMSSDEQMLRNIEQELARAWRQHDRAFIETVLAPEWSVTQADGSMLTRQTVLGTFFDAVTFDSNVIDDVSVALFGDTAVVRGRAVASGRLNGAPVSARIRFTDVFIKRNGRWLVVASHASPALSPTNPIVGQTGTSAPADSPFVGFWQADLSRSKVHAASEMQSASLQFAVSVDTVSITDSVVNASGQQQGHGTTTFVADGKEHAHDELLPGLVVVAQWHGSSVLETVLKRKDGQTDRVTYDVSADRKTLTTRTSGKFGDQVIVFDRK